MSLRRARWVVLPAALALAVVVEWEAFNDGDRAVALADGVVGVVLLITGAVAWDQRSESRTGPLTVATGLSWFAGTVAAPALFWHRGPLTHVLLAYPSGRTHGHLEIAVVAIAYVVAFVPLLAESDGVAVALAAAIVVTATHSYVSSFGPARRARRPALIATAAFSGVLAFGALARVAGWDASRSVLFTYDAVVAAIAIGLTADLLRARWAAAAVADLVVALGQGTRSPTLREQLARALGDPSLTLGYWLPDAVGYVDDAGRPIELPAPGGDRAVTEIADGAHPVAVLVHDASAVDDPRLLGSVAAAARLAMANARMQAESRARVVELAASRQRIVESSDDQRRRLERALSAGPDLTLRSVLTLLGDARLDATPAEAAQLDELTFELDSAMTELRAIAHGIRPPSLEAGGLAAALPILSARAPVPVAVSVQVGRLRPAVEAALYFVCSEALTNVAKHARAHDVSITIVVTDSLVVAEVVDDGVGGVEPTAGTGLRGLADRVEALGGRFTASDRPAGGAILHAELPLTAGGSTAS